MIKKIIPDFILTFFTEGHQRTLKAKKNILISFIIKGIDILNGLIRVPLILSFLSTEKYGIWLTLGSILSWFAFFDIGLGNGLRNKLAEALAMNNRTLARTYVSTTYALVSIIMGFVLLVFIIINPFLSWTSILNTSDVLSKEVTTLAFIVIIFFALRFVLNLIGTVLTADQKPSTHSILVTSSSIIYTLLLYLLKITSTDSLIYVGLASGITPIVILSCASLYFFKGVYCYLSPSFKYINFKYIKELGGLGVQFFILQICALVVFTTDNMIITQVLGPKHVVPYNISYSYTSIISMAFGIIMWPFWSAYTEAYVKDDIRWIKNTTRRLLQIWMLSILATIVLVIISNPVYNLWLGDNVKIPILLTSVMGLYFSISTWNNIYVFFINGVGKIRLQLLIGIFTAILNIPVSIFFAKYLNMGSVGVILGNCLCLSFSMIVMPIQYYKIINKKAFGIWGK